VNWLKVKALSSSSSTAKKIKTQTAETSTLYVLCSFLQSTIFPKKKIRVWSQDERNHYY
jgi:hypothetical protein